MFERTKKFNMPYDKLYARVRLAGYRAIAHWYIIYADKERGIVGFEEPLGRYKEAVVKRDGTVTYIIKNYKRQAACEEEAKTFF